MDLICCPKTSVAEVCREHLPSHVLTFASPGTPQPSLPAGPAHLHLAFNDIAEPRAGLVPPAEAHARDLVDFGRSWNGAQPLVVSCEAGISRSTAALFIIACDRRPDMAEQALAERLRAAAPCATPNPLLVSLADRILGRQDRMILAAAAIGRGADYLPYRSFLITFPPLG
jgi:predicted protein tyrosine phosphatase